MNKTFTYLALALLTVVLSISKSMAQTPQYSVVGGTINNLFPFNTTSSNKVQWIYLASDFPTAPSGLITDIFVKCGSAVTGNPTYTNFDIKMGSTSLTAFTAGLGNWNTGLQQVLFSSTYTMLGVTNGGWIQIPLQTPFFYNNTQNFIVEISQSSYTNGFNVPQNSSVGIRRMYGNVTAAQGTGNTGLQDFGFNLVTTYYPIGTGGGSFCTGESTVLRGSAPGKNVVAWYWIDPKGNYIWSDTIALNNMDTSMNGYYTLYVIYQPGFGLPIDTSGATLVGVNVNLIPNKPSVAPLTVYCQNEPFDTVSAFGQNLKWYTVPSGGTPNTGPPIVNTAQLGTSTNYVSQTVNGCESPRAPVTINVVPKPPPPQVIAQVKYCQGDTPSPLQAWGQNIRWYSVPTGGVGISIVPTPTTNAQGTFTWYVTQTVAGCESKRTPVTVSVSYIPNALIKVSRPYVCQYDTLTFNYFGNALSTADYIWTMPNGATILSGSGQGPVIVRFDSAGVYTIRLTVDNKGCIGPEATLTVPVRLSPKFTLDMQPDVCKNELVNVAVSYSTTGIDKFNWNGFDGAEVVYGALPKGPFGIRWNTPGQKIITVVATDDICKSAPTKDTIMVHDLPDAHITVTSSSICSGDSVEFSAPFEPGNTYQWLPFQFFDQSNSSVKWGTVDYTRSVVLNVTNSYNCRATDSVLITAKPCCQVYFPNAFSPNGDGKNDFFKVISSGHHEITSLRVQNRWGQTVFETADESKGWDGTMGGKPQDMGTYFYYIKYKCSDNKFYEDKGELMLVR